MGEERIELEQLNIVLFQSLAVLFSAYIVSLFKDAEYTSQTIAILYLLHFVAFYISNIAYRFYSRGYLDHLYLFYARWGLFDLSPGNDLLLSL